MPNRTELFCLECKKIQWADGSVGLWCAKNACCARPARMKVGEIQADATLAQYAEAKRELDLRLDRLHDVLKERG